MKAKNIRKKGKVNINQPICESKTENLNSNSEAPMDLRMIAPLSAIGLGLLLFLANRVVTRSARQPILIERRRIIYRRSQNNKF
jgi:hypothetical protein